MNDASGSTSDRDSIVADLRTAIGAIASRSVETVRQARPTPEVDEAGEKPSSGCARQPERITYPGIPEDPNWMQHLPARYHDGQNGFDRRIMEDLAAVDVRCYMLGELANHVKTIPQGIPIFIDWLNHLEQRIPGPETHHREAIRAGLIRNLNDPAARGNQAAIDALTNQLHRQPPMPNGLIGYATEALARIATKRQFDLIARLIDEFAHTHQAGPLIEYLGRVKTPEARDLALRYMDTPSTYFALRALTQMKASGVRDRVAPYVKDSHSAIRKEARRAMNQLPE